MRCPLSERWRTLLREPVADKALVNTCFRLRTTSRCRPGFGNSWPSGKGITVKLRPPARRSSSAWAWSMALERTTASSGQARPSRGRVAPSRMEDEIEAAVVLGSCHPVIFASRMMRGARLLFLRTSAGECVLTAGRIFPRRLPPPWNAGLRRVPPRRSRQ